MPPNSMFPAWPGVSRIADKTPVDAATANIPIDHLTERTDQLRDAVETHRLGEVLMYRGAPLDPTVEVGDAVVYSPNLHVFFPALFEIGDSARVMARVVGIVAEKATETIGTVIVRGTFRRPVLQVEGEAGSGPMYLSETTPGAVTLTRPLGGSPLVVYYHEEVDVATVTPENPIGLDALEFQVVTSLAPAAGSPIVVTNADGLPASFGDLKLGVDLNLTTETGGPEDGTVVVGGSGSKLLTRTHVASVESLSPYLSVSSATGHVQIDFTDPSMAGRLISPTLTQLDGARQSRQNGILYLELPPGRASQLTFKFDVPELGLLPEVEYEMQLKCRMVATAAGTVPTITVSGRSLGVAAGWSAVPGSDSIEGTIPGGSPGGFSYIDVLSTAFDVVRGSTLFLTTSRDTDAYSGGVGFLHVQGIIQPKE